VIKIAKILTDVELDKILVETSASIYFFQREKQNNRAEFKPLYEEDGSVIVTFLSGIAKVEPDEEDLTGKMWNPRLKDKDGKPREAWDKYEAKCRIKDRELIYGFGGKNGALFREFRGVMMDNKIMNKDLPSTRWKITCVDFGRYQWNVEFLDSVGDKIATDKETVDEISEEKKPKDDEYSRVVDGVTEVKEKNKGRVLAGLSEDELIDAVGFISGVDRDKVKGYLSKLAEDKIISISEDKIYIQ